MATSKPDILIILLQKLMEEGNLLYKVRTDVKVQCLWFLKGGITEKTFISRVSQRADVFINAIESWPISQIYNIIE